MVMSWRDRDLAEELIILSFNKQLRAPPHALPTHCFSVFYLFISIKTNEQLGNLLGSERFLPRVARVVAHDSHLLFPPAWHAFPISGISKLDLYLGKQTSLSDHEVCGGAGSTPPWGPGVGTWPRPVQWAYHIPWPQSVDGQVTQNGSLRALRLWLAFLRFSFHWDSVRRMGAWGCWISHRMKSTQRTAELSDEGEHSSWQHSEDPGSSHAWATPRFFRHTSQ